VYATNPLRRRLAVVSVEDLVVLSDGELEQDRVLDDVHVGERTAHARILDGLLEVGHLLLGDDDPTVEAGGVRQGTYGSNRPWWRRPTWSESDLGRCHSVGWDPCCVWPCAVAPQYSGSVRCTSLRWRTP
jgi:hypothetical protein